MLEDYIRIDTTPLYEEATGTGIEIYKTTVLICTSFCSTCGLI